jgi:hypothetical protein
MVRNAAHAAGVGRFSQALLSKLGPHPEPSGIPRLFT